MNFSACLYCSVDCLLTYSCRVRSSRTCVHRCSRRLNWGRGGRSSVRIYLFVYTFSPLSICTPGDNIQSPNGKKRKRDPILPSFLRHMSKKLFVVQLTPRASCSAACFFLPFLLIWRSILRRRTS